MWFYNPVTLDAIHLIAPESFKFKKCMYIHKPVNLIYFLSIGYEEGS